MEKYRLSVERAAKLMDASAQFVRRGLQKGVLPFGYAVQMSDRNYTYWISPVKFSEYTGIPLNEVMDQCETKTGTDR